MPDELYDALRQAPLVVRVQCSTASRLDILVEDYSAATTTAADGRSRAEWLEKMKASVAQLRKRFGDENVARVVAALDAGDWRGVAEMLIVYYDRLYDKHIKVRRE